MLRPGSFLLRELPRLLEVLRPFRAAVVHTIVIDGYVWLAKGRPGLGARPFEALGSSIAVVGVAKTSCRRVLPRHSK